MKKSRFYMTKVAGVLVSAALYGGVAMAQQNVLVTGDPVTAKFSAGSLTLYNGSGSGPAAFNVGSAENVAVNGLAIARALGENAVQDERITTLEQAVEGVTATVNDNFQYFQDWIDQEITTRDTQDTGLQNLITAETTARTNAINTINTAIAAETSARQAAVASLKGEVTHLDGRINTVQANLATETANRIAADKALDNKINAETARAKQAEKKLDQKISLTSSVASASLVNIIAHELTPDALKAEGVSFYGNVGLNQATGTAETVVGASKNLGNGFSAGVGVGTESAQIGAHAGWNHRVHQNVNVGVGASVSERGINVGPHAQLTDDSGQFGVGMSLAGPSVIVGGVNLPVLAPPVAVANVVVAGVTKAYKAIDEKKQAPIKALNAKFELATAQLEEAKADFDVKLSAAQADAKAANDRAAALEAQMQELKAMFLASQAKNPVAKKK